MQTTSLAPKIPLPFAGAGAKNAIPLNGNAQPAGTANFSDGFPLATSLPIAGGGVPPKREDMNGVLYSVSAGVQWAQAGGSAFYDAVFSAAIGGYPRGAILMKSDLSGRFISTVENNTSNPEAGGANWFFAKAIASLIPDALLGKPIPSPTGILPSGCLPCNGATFNAATYPRLAAALGGNVLPNISVGYTTTQAASGFNTLDIGENLAHTHDYVAPLPGNGTAGTVNAAYTFGATPVTSSGGAINRAAGLRVLYFVLTDLST